jgi:head-tail adaptor
MSGKYVLNRKLVLEKPVTVADGAGGFAETWSTLGAVWANVDARSVRMRQVARGENSVIKFRIIVRAAPVGSSARPKPEQRLRDGATAYRIEAVRSADDTGLYLECWASEEVAQ